MSSVIRKVKNAIHSDTPSGRYHPEYDEDIPGSYPDDRREPVAGYVSDRLKDGGEYVAPSGTAVGHHGQDRSSYEHGDHGFAEPRVDDRFLMDPADRGHGSNVMNTTGDGGDPVTASERVTSTSSGSHHNKLQKRRDSRGNETAAVGYTETGHVGDPLRTSGSLRRQEGYGDLHDSDRHGQYPGAATMAAGGLAGAGAGALGTHELTERHRHQSGTDPSTGAYAGDVSHKRDSHPGYGQGVYNTVTGAGSGEDYDRTDYQRYGTSTGTQQPGLAAAAGTTAATATAAGASHAHHTSAQQGYTGSEQWPLGHSSSATDRRPMATDTIPRDTMRDNTAMTQPTSGLSSGLQSHDARGVSSAAPSAPIVTGSGGGAEHWGPGHPWSKILHKCSNCGHDDDITHYFKKDVSFRLG